MELQIQVLLKSANYTNVRIRLKYIIPDDTYIYGIHYDANTHFYITGPGHPLAFTITKASRDDRDTSTCLSLSKVTGNITVYEIIDILQPELFIFFHQHTEWSSFYLFVRVKLLYTPLPTHINYLIQYLQSFPGTHQ
jgi:hypothetical protein